MQFTFIFFAAKSILKFDIFLLICSFEMNNILKNNFNVCFNTFSFYFILLFFLLPYLLLIYSGQLIFAGRIFSLTAWGDFLVVGSLALFLFGFFVMGYIRPYLCKYKISGHNQNYSYNNLFTFCAIFYIGYLFILILDDSRVTSAYDSRVGNVGLKDRIYFVLSNIFGVIKFTVIFALVACDKRFLAFLLLIFSLGVDFYGAIGRVQLLLSIALLVIVVFRFKTIKLIHFSMIAVLLLFLPLISNLKSIIYYLTFNEFNVIDFFRFIELDFDVGEFSKNFGHPFYSLLIADSLIQKEGYSYFFDYIRGLFYYTKIFGFGFDETLTHANTENILGYRISMVPPGYLAFGYVQLSFVGVFFSGVVYRLVGIFSEFIYIKYGNGIEPLKFLLVFLSANTFYHGELGIMMLTFFLPVLLIPFSLKLVLKK